MQRGFKSWCEKCTEEYRTSIGIGLDEPLDPTILAKSLGVKVWLPTDVPDVSQTHLDQLLVRDPTSWSAVTLSLEGALLTIINSSHSSTRQRSSLTHELAHIILKHKPGRIDLSPSGHLLLNSYANDQEEEADWLSGSLLVPREGLLKAFRRNSEVDSLASHFQVSQDLLNWRLRMTGVAKQVFRSKRSA